MKWLNLLICKYLWLHDFYRSAAFEKTCEHCGAIYRVDPLSFSQTGQWTWHRVE